MTYWLKFWILMATIILLTLLIEWLLCWPYNPWIALGVFLAVIVPGYYWAQPRGAK